MTSTKAKVKISSLLRQPLIPTAQFPTALRITLIVISILAGLYCALGFCVTGFMFYAFFFAYLNFFTINTLAALISLTTHLSSVVLYLTLCIISFIFAKRLIKKQPISQKLLVTFIVVLAFNIVSNYILPDFFSFVFTIIGS